ncbi:MAG TPA: PKD domain-containing protein [Solirubrobacteraceae bacterium]|nr:PKD domain-containing protein [Solirubrobacteraceae bacterium]
MRRRSGTTLAAALAAVALAALPVGASAVILPATTIDGPSEEIAGFGGVAMAEDGSGGLVYLKRVDGVPHVFVSRYVGGHWLAPIRVDRCSPSSTQETSTGEAHCEEPYAASWPRIGAAAGGELIVVWATPFATSPSTGKPIYELLASVLGPGGEQFGQAMIVDRDIEEGTGTDPDLAVSSTGMADVVYRVIDTEKVGISLLRAGDVPESVRVAHFDGQRWSNLGAINRDAAVGMRPPTQDNAPQIAIGPTGNGIVVWQEPDIEGVARIWARRVFSSSLDYVMPVSAETYNGAPITDDADAPSVAFSRLGQAEVAYRQAAGPSSPLPGPRIFVNILPDGESANGGEFQGAVVADQAVSGGRAAYVGPPSIDIDEKRSMLLLYDSNGTPRVIEGNDKGLAGALSLGSPFAGSEPNAVSVMNPEGGGIAAWPSVEAQGHPAVAVREGFPGGAAQTALLSGGAGGEVAELAVGRSGLGDGLIAFRQGQLGNAAIVAAQATAPPDTFILTVPKGWVRPSQATASWAPAVSAAGPLTYHLVLDGRIQPTPAGVLTAHLNPRGLSSGRHRLQVLATDSDGQSTLSAASTLLIDGVPPSARITRAQGDTAVRVGVLDRFSGVDRQRVSVSFGDGSRARGRTRFAHRYRHPGVYRVVVHVRDKIGNEGVVSQWVSVR